MYVERYIQDGPGVAVSKRCGFWVLALALLHMNALLIAGLAFKDVASLRRYFVCRCQIPHGTLPMGPLTVPYLDIRCVFETPPVLLWQLAVDLFFNTLICVRGVSLEMRNVSATVAVTSRDPGLGTDTNASGTKRSVNGKCDTSLQYSGYFENS